MSSRVKRIVVVDDMPPLTELMIVALASLADEVIPFNSGERALEYLEELGPCEIVVTDFYMGRGVMNGISLAAKIRERWPGTKILLTTTDNGIGLSTSSLIDEFVEKPALVKTYREVVERMIEKSKLTVV